MKRDEFITADLHLGHRGVIKYSGRPFEDTREMDAAIVANWNRKVPHGSVVYLLGDVSFHRPDQTRILLGQLNGTIRIVLGNHDKKSNRKALTERAEWVRDYYESKTEASVKVCMFHYALMTWNGMHRQSWMLHGHSHGSLRDNHTVRRLDIGIDTHPLFEPYSFGEVEKRMAGRGFVAVDHHEERT